MLKAKLLSSLDKVFIDDKINNFAEFSHVCAFRGGRVSLQIALCEDDPTFPYRRWINVRVLGDGIPDDAFSMRMVDHVVNYQPVFTNRYDSGYARTTPGLYPDMLSPLQMGGAIPCPVGHLRTAWVDVELPADPSLDGEHHIVFELLDGEKVLPLSLDLTVIPAKLPADDFKVTQWFHCDCLANFYNAEVFSERHWEIVENFVRTAVKNGINTLLTPVFTPPLDTHVGGERRTAQLVGVTLDSDGKYTFDFSLVGRWIDMCDRCGIKYLEISHLFTQWGAAHAPKIMAQTPDGYRRIFGWDTDATGNEYPPFLRQFLTEFLAYMKARGDDKRCIFHVSDEPNGEQLEQYLRSKAVVADLLEGYTMIDALSNVDFYHSGAITTPVPSTDHIVPFLEAYDKEGKTGLWTYYCCGQNIGTSNRYLAMTGARTRFIGVQFYKYRIGGFLQWGYNFYNNQGSYDPINPLTDVSGNYFFPAGDGFSVYPSLDGTALESMRIIQFKEALDDMRAMRFCESLIGREKTLSAVEAIAGSVVFDSCVNDTATMLKIRETVDRLILEALKR